MQHFQTNGYDGYHLCPSCAATSIQVHPEPFVDTMQKKVYALGKLSLKDIAYLQNSHQKKSGEIPLGIKLFLQNYLNVENVGKLNHQTIQNYILEAKNNILSIVSMINRKQTKSPKEQTFLRIAGKIIPEIRQFF